MQWTKWKQMATNRETVIPASQRPDGTWRKEIRVKAGYVPPDEVPRYHSKGREWSSNENKLPPGMIADSDVQSETKKSKNQKKNERRKLKKLQQAQIQNEDIDDGITDLGSKIDKLKIGSETVGMTSSSTSSELTKETIAKKIKGLKKKLRQIEELESKISSGQIPELTKEQKEKVSKKSVILGELEDLELDMKLCEH